ncbi:MAG: PQQ-binding-like beta-propeller repeat protein, partial [Candidatus Acidiferrum sp.]
MLDTGRSEAAAHDRENAKTNLRQAASEEFGSAERAAALLETGDIWTDAHQPDYAKEVWQKLADDAELRDIVLPGFVQGGQQAARRIAAQSAGLPQAAKKQLAHVLPAVQARRNLAVNSRQALSARQGVSDSNAMRETEPSKYRSMSEQSWNRAWETPLGPSGQLLAATGDVFLTIGQAASNPLTCHALRTGDLLWRITSPFQPNWANAASENIVIGGPRGLAAIRRADGKLVWRFLIPSHGLREELTGFRSASNIVYCLAGGKRLLAINAAKGELNWQRRAPHADLLPPGVGGFVGHYYADSRVILIQSADGHRYVFDAANGKTISDHPAAALWTTDPAPGGAGRILVVEGPREVVCLNSADGAECWRHLIPGATTLTGAPPRVRAAQETVLLLIET